MVDIARLGIAVDSSSPDKATASLDKMTASAKKAETATKQLTAASATEGTTIKSVTAEIDRMGQVVDMTVRRTEQLKRATDNAARSVGLARHEWINFGRQMQDVGTMAAMGSSPMSIITSQTAQLADIFMSTQGTMRGFFSQLMAGARAALPLMGALGAAAAGASAAAAGIAYNSSQRELQRQLFGVGAGSGASVAGLNAIAAGQSGMSRGDARQIAGGFAGAGINRSLIPGLTSATVPFGRITGQSATDAGADLASAFADPAKGADKLNERLGFLDGSLRQFIQNAQASGDRLSAQKALFDAFNKSIDEAREPLWAYQQAWKNILNVVDAVGAAVSNAVSPDKMTLLARAQRDVAVASVLPFGGFGKLEPAVANRDALLRSIRNDRERADTGAANAETKALSISGGNAVRDILSDVRELQGMRNTKDLLTRLIGNPEALRTAGVTAEQAGEALKQFTTRVNEFKTATEKVAQESQIQVQNILAFTFAEKTAAAQLQAFVSVLNASGNAALAAASAEKVRNEMIAQSIKQAQDGARAATNALALVPLRGLERERESIRQEYRQIRATNSGAAASLPGVTGEQYGPPVPRTGFDPGRFGTYSTPAPGSQEDRARAAMRSTVETQMSLGNRDAWQVGRMSLANGILTAQEAAARGVPSSGAAAPAAANSNGLPTRGPGSADASNAAAEAARHQAAIEAASTEIMRDRNKELDQQIKLTEMQADAITASSQAQQVAIERQRILNDFERAGVNEKSVGAAKWRELTQSVDDYAARAVKATEKSRELAMAMQNLDQMRSLVGDTLKGVFSDFIGALNQGKTAWQALEQAGVNALNRIATKLWDMYVDNLVSKAFGAGTQGSGFLGGILKALGLGGGGGYAPVGGGTGTAGLYHGGRGPGEAGMFRSVDMGLFRGAPRYHSGIGPGEQAAIIRNDESVLTPGQMRAMGGSARVSVTLINNGTPQRVDRQEEESDGRGGRNVKLVTSDAVADAISRPGSSANTAVQNSFAAPRRVTKR